MNCKYPIIIFTAMVFNACNHNSKDDMYPTTVQIQELTGDIKPQLDSLAAGKTTSIVCYGNSITYGSRGDNFMQASPTYPASLQTILQAHYSNNHIAVTNEGHPGWTATQGLQSADTLVIAKHPDICTIEFGINDVVQNLSIATFEQSLTGLCQRLKAANITVILLAPTPILLSQNTTLVEFCKSVQKVAAAEGVGFINVHYRIVERMKTDQLSPAVLLPDKVHFINDGYQLISSEITKYLFSI